MLAEADGDAKATGAFPAIGNPGAGAKGAQRQGLPSDAGCCYSLTDLRGLSRADAVASLVRTAQTITAAAIADMRCAP